MAGYAEHRVAQSTKQDLFSSSVCSVSTAASFWYVTEGLSSKCGVNSANVSHFRNQFPLSSLFTEVCATVVVSAGCKGAFPSCSWLIKQTLPYRVSLNRELRMGEARGGR